MSASEDREPERMGHATPRVGRAGPRSSSPSSRRVLGAALLLACAATSSLAGAANAAADRGAAVYRKYCATCHGDRAQGYAGDHAPSLVTSTFLASASDDFLRAAIDRGRPGTAMAGYGRAIGGPLDPEQVGDVIAFLRANAPAGEAPPPPPSGGTGNAAAGLEIYYQACASCHGTQKGRGKAVHLFNPFFLATASDDYLTYAIVRGRPGTDMEAWAGKLSAVEIKDVVAFLRAAAPEGSTSGKDAGSEHRPSSGLEQVVVNPGGRPAELSPHNGHFVPMAQVKQALDENRRIVIVDARAPSDWRQLRIPGAISLPYYDLSGIDRLPKDDTWIVAYCACPHHLSEIIVNELVKRGYEHAAVLDEGVLAWQEAGYPIHKAPDAPPPPPAAAKPAAAK